MITDPYPALEKGVNLLKKPENSFATQAILSSELAGKSVEALWIDSENQASTYQLQKHGNQQTLEKVNISRVFTPLQHFKIIQDLDKHITKETELLCLSCPTVLYKDMNSIEAEEVFRETWNKIIQMQEKHGLKILVTQNQSSRKTDLSLPIIRDTDQEIKLKQTKEGWKFQSENYEQLIYHSQKSVQTTMKYWNKQRNSQVRERQVKQVKNQHHG